MQNEHHSEKSLSGQAIWGLKQRDGAPPKSGGSGPRLAVFYICCILCVTGATQKNTHKKQKRISDPENPISDPENPISDPEPPISDPNNF